MSTSNGSSSIESYQVAKTRTAVFTANFGGKDKLQPPVHFETSKLSDVDFLYFTDSDDVQIDHYQVVKQKPSYSDVAKNARKLKILGFPGMENYKYAIWHDSSIQMDCSKIIELQEFAETSMLSTFKHGREDVYLEAIACIENGKDQPLRVLKQMWRYFKAGLPAHSGLYETGILTFNVGKYLKSDLKNVWWQEIENGSRRDQLSLPFAVRKTDTENEVGILPGSGHVNPFSTYIGHEYDHYIDGSTQISRSSLLKKLAVALIYRFRFHSPTRH